MMHTTRRVGTLHSKRRRRRGKCVPRKLYSQALESRLLLAQTTGLFFNDPGTSDGYVLFSPNTTQDTYLIDKNGSVVHQWHSDYVPGLLGYLLEDGSILRDAAAGSEGQGGNGTITAAGAGGHLERIDWSGDVTWTFDYGVGTDADHTHLAHHDFEVMPNGNILLIAWEYKSAAEATQAGRDPNLAGQGFLYPDHIIEVHPDYVNGGGTIVWQWHIWDHLVQNFNAAMDNYLGPTGVDDHPELININYVSNAADGGGAREDWTHANGIDYNADLDQIVLSSREFSEFWIIDHSTTTAEAASHSGGNSGKGGDLLYRWGNPQTYGRGTESDRELFFQHDPQWIADGLPGAGHITVFNNGYGRPGTDYSEVDEIVLPYDANGDYPALASGETYGPTSPVWSYTATPPVFSHIISGAQRLPNGNTLIDYGINGTFSEVKADGTEVWKYVNPYTEAGTLGMEETIPLFPQLGLFENFTFQAIHYPSDYLSNLPSTIAGTGHEGRCIFYNHSKFDGNSDTNNASDDNAIPDNKTVYLPGDGQMVLANITNFSRGLNGIMVDLTAGSADHTLINASDFVFKVGANNSPDLWATLTATPTISVRTGAGVSGSDRVDITWNNNAIQNQYLEVQVLATAHTGMDATFGTIGGNAVGDVFFFGNLIGETNSVTPGGAFARSLSADGNPIVAAGVLTSVGIDSFLDVDRSNSITLSGDRNPIVAGGVGSMARISIGTAGLFAPEGGGGAAPATGGGDVGISSGLAATSGSSSSSSSTLALPASVATRLDSASSVAPTARAIELFFHRLAAAATGETLDDLSIGDSADWFGGLLDPSSQEQTTEHGWALDFASGLKLL